MKGSFFNRPLEWSLETQGESWQQGSLVKGTVTVKNHSSDSLPLEKAGVALAYGELKKVHAKTEGALTPEVEQTFDTTEIKGGETLTLPFSLQLPPNCLVSDKKSSYFFLYGRSLSESHLQMKVEPKSLFLKIIGLMDTFYRFKLKEVKSTKNGVEFKLIPPSSRDMANLESLILKFSMDQETLNMHFSFQVKKLDMASVTTKLNKETIRLEKSLSPREYSLGGDMINQDQLLKTIEAVLSEVKFNVY